MSASSPRRKREGAEAPAGESPQAAPESARAWERAASRHATQEKPARVVQSRRTMRGARERVKASAPPREQVAAEKPIGYIIQNLERAYGVPVNKWTDWDPLDMLVATVLSQATSDANSERTWDALKRRFPTWDAVLRARESTLADTIRMGGLANQKARVIQDLLRGVKQQTGALTLEPLRDATVEEAVNFLSSLRGVGPKTVACTLLFACDKEVFPLDTHIFRILRRLGLVPGKCSDRRAHEIMNRLVPAGKFYSFHVNLIRHGRKLCRPRDPLCEQCPIVEYCDYGRSRV